ncbi:hypothetical protein [Pseudoalteromonas pernae]|uniref:hypothetical protein n=1 Tax=Pseudoalteromonas pernae TaxID=3118054 RepID=UPI003242C1D2
MRCKKFNSAFCYLAIAASSVACMNAHANQWEFKVEPYLMATSIDGDSAIGTLEAPLTVDFGTILDNLDSAFMVRFEAFHGSNWGVITDWGYMDLKKSLDVPRDGVLSARVRQGVLEVSLAYKHHSKSVGNWVNYVGLRRWDNTYQFDVDTAMFAQTRVVDRDEDWVDIILGFSYNREFAEKWHFNTAADIGGFGLSAKMTSSLKLGVVYDLTENWDMSFQYKATYVDYDTGDRGSSNYFSYDSITHGPLMSASYKF